MALSSETRNRYQLEVANLANTTYTPADPNGLYEFDKVSDMVKFLDDVFADENGWDNAGDISQYQLYLRIKPMKKK